VSGGAGELVVLGAGTILPRPGLGPASLAVRAAPEAPWVLFDCGPGTVRSLGAHGIAVGDVAAVVLSHFHPDHCLDLWALLFARRNPELRDLAPLHVLAPAGLARVHQAMLDGFGKWLDEPRARFEEFRLEDDRWSGRLDLGDAGCALSLSAAANGHTPHAVSWRIGLPSGFVLAFSGDTGEDPRVADCVAGADLFVCECAFPSDREPEHHLTPASAARLGARAGVRRMLLTHFYPGLDGADAAREVSAAGVPASAAHDGLRVKLVTPRER
jgi:ribonuclease BN (tRNA processing enzyme)